MLAFALLCFALVRETQTHVLGATCNSCSEFPCPPFLVSKQIVETKMCHTMFTAVVASPLLRLPSTQSCLCLVPFFIFTCLLFSFFSHPCCSVFLTAWRES
uniref:Secreted protein n=1 Tax=Rhipicephalus appendiculatus TaxID=34631 RepID=A0A131YCD0_RHIAP